MRKPSLAKSFKARTTEKYNRKVKKYYSWLWEKGHGMGKRS